METPLKSILNLFAPPLCEACNEPLPEGVDLLCPQCRWEMPLTDTWNIPDNPIFQKFWGLTPVEAACSLFYYRTDSRFRKMVHDLKYRGYWRTCQAMGEMLAEHLINSEPYSSAELIIPVPLHRRRLLTRTYNQSEQIAKGMARILNCKVESRCLYRKFNNSSQARSKDRLHRWDNVQDLFSVRHPERLANRRIILVDDVLTTGATLISCAQAIAKAAPDCHIFVATLAVSEYEIKQSKKNLTHVISSEYNKL